MDGSELRLEIDPANERAFGPCACCGQNTRRVWGKVHQGHSMLAVYYVQWNPAHPDDANFDFILGGWVEGDDASRRQAVALVLRQLETGPAFMVVDANSRAIAQSTLISKALTREEVIGRPIAATVFALCDAVWLGDARLADLTR